MIVTSASIIAFLKKLKLRPAMYFRDDDNYEHFALYLDGYLMGLNCFVDKDLLQAINTWYFNQETVK